MLSGRAPGRTIQTSGGVHQPKLPIMSQPISFGPVTVFPGDKNGKYPDGNQVLVRGREALAAFDTPLSTFLQPERLNGVDLVILGHVHEDHVCALGQIPHVPVHAPEEDAPALRSLDGLMDHYGYGPDVTAIMRRHVREHFHFAPRPDASGYRDAQVWDLGGVTVHAWHMPGHTGGHSVLLVEPDGIAFIGDIDLSGFGPYYGDACSDLARFLVTLERMQSLPAKVWITSHHKGVVTEAGQMRTLLARFRERIFEREKAIAQALMGGGKTLAELVAQRFLYPPGYHEIFVDDVEAKTIREHLKLLIAGGKVVEEGGRFRAA